MKLIEFIELLRQEFQKELAVKTGWGRVELTLAFERAVSTALARSVPGE